MSKGLEALKEIKHTTDLDRPNELNGYKKELDIIEKELKEYEQLKQLKLLPYPQENGEDYRQGVIKKLMALEIIKEKRVLIDVLLDTDTIEDYNDFKSEQELLTQQEYDLLNEVLKWKENS